MGDEERIAYLAGDTTAPLDADERADLDSLRGVLADPAVWAEPGPDLEEQVVAAITRAAHRNSVPPAASSERVAAPVDELAGRRRSRRVIYAVIGLAAAVLLAVGVTVVATRHGTRPVQYAASLTGTGLAPSASGRATLTQTTGGWRIRLTATGLVRLDNGAFYEAWLKNGSGTLVPIGTFNEPTDITLWAGVPPSGYPTLTVTRQQAGSGNASSGQVVLKGVTSRVH
jgi:hypothetical protein